MGPKLFWRDPIVDPNDMKLVAVHVGGDASKQTAPTHAALPNKRFCSKLSAKNNWVSNWVPNWGNVWVHDWVPRNRNWVPIGSLHKKLGPHLRPHLGPSMMGSDHNDVMVIGVQRNVGPLVQPEGSRTIGSRNSRNRGRPRPRNKDRGKNKKRQKIITKNATF